MLPHREPAYRLARGVRLRDHSPMRKSALPSPFRDAAEALDRELERYATLAGELRREPVTSEKSLRRSARIPRA
jgi:hypothetical protein